MANSTWWIKTIYGTNYSKKQYLEAFGFVDCQSAIDFRKFNNFSKKKKFNMAVQIFSFADLIENSIRDIQNGGIKML